MKYLEDRMAEWDEYAIKETARKEGIKEGREEGREEGVEKGKAAVVKNLILKMGLSDKQIVEVAEVSLNFVKKIRKSLPK